VGGAIVTQIISVVMVAASVYAGYIMMQAYHSATPEVYFMQFLITFVVVFAASGIGNGSTFRTVGVIFDRTQAGPVLGWTSAVAAYGSFIAPEVIDPAQGRHPGKRHVRLRHLLRPVPGAELVVLPAQELGNPQPVKCEK
jgi:nitrate/nitrite transporter NarK